ncbi:nitroreductase family protein [Baekduia sp. Peel2402]|uniref:nitroreductase family protein n=1 Tax=Baekduia sp. Peel2402 TaxID=3458296 RepID=UPI00403ED68B
MTSFDTEQTDALLSTTRAVRKRLDLERPVPPELILECLELAHQSPIGGNHEVRRWVVVTEPALKQRLAELYRVSALPYLRARAAERTEDATHQRVGDSALFLAENLERVPALVLSCLDEPIDLSSNGNAAPTYGSVMPAIWSFQLALRSRGLGSAWTTLHLGEEAAAAELLGIPDGVAQIALLPVAYTIGTDFKPARRQSIRELTYWNRWGQTDTPRPS